MRPWRSTTPAERPNWFPAVDDGIERRRRRAPCPNSHPNPPVDFVDDKTGGKHTDTIEGVAGKAKEGIDKFGGDSPA